MLPILLLYFRRRNNWLLYSFYWKSLQDIEQKHTTNVSIYVNILKYRSIVDV